MHPFNEPGTLLGFKPVHHIEVIILGEPNSKFFVDHAFHVCRYNRDLECFWSKFNAGISLFSAFNNALVWD